VISVDPGEIVRSMDRIAERRTSRLLLKAITMHDLSAFDAMHRNPDVMATLGGVRSTAETEAFIEDTIRHWTEHGFGLWAVHGLGSRGFMGRGGLRHVVVAGRADVEVAYALLPQFWGQGFATELARESVRVAFSELRLSEVVGFTQVTNDRSRNVLENAGLRFEREFVHAGFPHVLFHLTKAEWTPHEPAQRAGSMNH
jgi:RimJ/RimL family protein N-acetyltransferase